MTLSYQPNLLKVIENHALARDRLYRFFKFQKDAHEFLHVSQVYAFVNRHKSYLMGTQIRECAQAPAATTYNFELP